MIINHRINSIEDLENVDSANGVEVDIRFNPSTNQLVLSHDLHFSSGVCSLNDFLNHYHHQLLILNIKSSLCEEPAIKLMQSYGIENYLFLDSQIPDIVKFSKLGYGNKFISRLSNFESLNENLLRICSKYIWVDTFGLLDFPMIEKRPGIEFIFVSPELHKKDYNIGMFRSFIDQNFSVYHICTDFEHMWK